MQLTCLLISGLSSLLNLQVMTVRTAKEKEKDRNRRNSSFDLYIDVICMSTLMLKVLDFKIFTIYNLFLKPRMFHLHMVKE